MTEEEKDYISNDVKIVAQALKVLFDDNLTKMTQGSNALFDYKNTVGKKRYERYFSELTKEEDRAIRKSYKGGFTYLSPEFTEKEVGNGVVLDVNSLYPSVMKFEKLPFRKSHLFFSESTKTIKFMIYIFKI